MLFQLQQAQKPFRKLSELTDRLEQRGAADENIWAWCETINKHVKRVKKVKTFPLDDEKASQNARVS